MKNLTTLLAVCAAALPTFAEIPAPGDIEPDYETHEGTTILVNRDCEAFMLEAYEAIKFRSYGSILEMTEATDGNVYFKYIVSEYHCEAYVKGERVGNTIVIKGPQALYNQYDDDTDTSMMIYLVPLSEQVGEGNWNTYMADENMEFVFNVGEDGSLVSADPKAMLGVCTYQYAQYLGGMGYVWSGYGDRDITVTKVTATPVVPPTYVEPENWVFQDEYDTALVSIIFDGEKDVYIQGLDRNLPNAWAKGTRTAENQIEFPSGQYMGPDIADLFFHYLCGADFIEVPDEDSEEPRTEASIAPSAIFRYDADNKSMHTVNGYMINGAPSKLFPLYFYHDLVIEVQHRDPDCPPAAPYGLINYENPDGNSLWFMVPNVDTDGNLLQESNLYYEIFLNGDPYELDIEYPGKEDHPTWVPYNFEDFDIYVLGRDHTVYYYADGVETYGVRSIYVNEEGKVLYSEICGDGDDSGLRDTGNNKGIESVEWYDMTGCRVQHPAAGLYIRTIRYSDGTAKTSKLLQR